MEIQIRPRSNYLTILSFIILSFLPFHCWTYQQQQQQSLSDPSPILISKLESKLLQLTGLKEVPPSTRKGNPTVPQHLLKLYEASHGNELETTHLDLPGRFVANANTVRTFYPTGQNHVHNYHHYQFQLDNNIPITETITGAELHVSVNISSSCSRLPIRIMMNDLTKRFKPAKEPFMYPIDTKLVKHSRLLTFDVFPAVTRWMSGTGSSKNYGLLLSVGASEQEEEELIRSDCEFRLSDPILFTYSDDKLGKKARSAEVLSRKYRSANGNGQKKGGRGGGGGGGGRGRGGHKHKNRKRALCSKHKMFVDFTDVGWNDWIVAPPGYHAYHCAGECPFPMADHLNATNHAVIQALVNSMNPQLVPPPCCVPTKYSSLSLLYTDSTDKIVLKNYNEMVVDSCGCS